VDRREFEALRDAAVKVGSQAPVGDFTVTREEFETILSEASISDGDQVVLQRMYSVADTNGDGKVDLRVFAAGLAPLHVGTTQDKLSLGFELMDPHATGSVSPETFTTALQAMASTASMFGDIMPEPGDVEALVAATFGDSPAADAKFAYKDFTEMIVSNPTLQAFLERGAKTMGETLIRRREEDMREQNGTAGDQGVEDTDDAAVAVARPPDDGSSTSSGTAYASSSTTSATKTVSITSKSRKSRK
jgi:Ca2+-binding EF-hand superfamily protein